VNISPAYDLAAVPEWAREPIARIASEQPENLASWLDHVAEIEAAKRYLAEYPPTRPAPPEDPREFLRLLAVEAWRSLASGQPAPSVDPWPWNRGSAPRAAAAVLSTSCAKTG